MGRNDQSDVNDNEPVRDQWSEFVKLIWPIHGDAEQKDQKIISQ